MDYTAITAAIDFADTLTAIAGAAAALMVPIVGIVGWRFVRSVLGR